MYNYCMHYIIFPKKTECEMARAINPRLVFRDREDSFEKQAEVGTLYMITIEIPSSWVAHS